MSTPLRFEDLTSTEHAWVCNGCGPKDGLDVPDLIFHEACCRHDFDYWAGRDESDRLAADRRFLHNMLAAVGSEEGWLRRAWFRFLAWRYYWAVRLFGGSRFKKRDSYGTRDDLVREMSGNFS